VLEVAAADERTRALVARRGRIVTAGLRGRRVLRSEQEQRLRLPRNRPAQADRPREWRLDRACPADPRERDTLASVRQRQAVLVAVNRPEDHRGLERGAFGAPTAFRCPPRLHAASARLIGVDELAVLGTRDVRNDEQMREAGKLAPEAESSHSQHQGAALALTRVSRTTSSGKGEHRVGGNGYEQIGRRSSA
jgi:hypothetical protein